MPAAAAGDAAELGGSFPRRSQHGAAMFPRGYVRNGFGRLLWGGGDAIAERCERAGDEWMWT